MIVVDTNIISYFLIRDEKFSEIVDRLFDYDSDWVAPRLWLDEYMNVLSTHVRNAGMAPEISVALLADAIDLMRDRSFEVIPERVMSVARRLECSAYDAQYVSLAEDMGLKFYSFDRRLVERCPDIASIPR